MLQVDSGRCFATLTIRQSVSVRCRQSWGRAPRGDQVPVVSARSLCRYRLRCQSNGITGLFSEFCSAFTCLFCTSFVCFRFGYLAHSILIALARDSSTHVQVKSVFASPTQNLSMPKCFSINSSKRPSSSPSHANASAVKIAAHPAISLFSPTFSQIIAWSTHWPFVFFWFAPVR